MLTTPKNFASVNSSVKIQVNLKYKILCWILGFSYITILLLLINNKVIAQSQEIWAPQQRIPGYDNDTRPPHLVVDQNRTVHAFSSQEYGGTNPQTAVIYNQWNPTTGWTAPVDILISPLKNYAEVLGVYLDETGLIHLVFYGGDQTEANIYYSQASANDAGRAPAWSNPILIGKGASSPVTAAMTGDDKGGLVVVYGGNIQGNGVYSIRSENHGKSWTEPYPIFLTYADELWPWGLQVYLGEAGKLHAIWNVVNEAGQGETIYYANLDMDEFQWNNPIQLVQAERGSLGAMHPTIIENVGVVFAAYFLTPKLVVQYSTDNGNSWSKGEAPFSSHVGVNGELSLAKDGNSDVHLLWGQRITGSPDIHGMWHSIYSHEKWSSPVAVVSKPRVVDLVGEKGFDPFDASAIISQGNVLLVTWRSDPGNIKPNGVWYSYNQLDSAELPVATLPSPSLTSTPTPTPLSSTLIPFNTSDMHESNPDVNILDSQKNAHVVDNPSAPVIVGAIPVVFMIAVIVILSFLRRDR